MDGNKKKRGNISMYLKNEGIRTAVIYGIGILGRHLCMEMVEAGIELTCVIDRQETHPNIRTVHLIDEMPETDMVAVAVSTEGYEIVRKIKENYFDCKVVTIQEMIAETMRLM